MVYSDLLQSSKRLFQEKLLSKHPFSLFCQHNREEMQKNSEFHGFEL